MLHLIASLAATAATPDLIAPLPPTIPWHGASERLIAPPGDPWITPAEASNFDATPVLLGNPRLY